MVDPALIHAMFVFIASLGFHVVDENVRLVRLPQAEIETMAKQVAYATCVDGVVYLGPHVDLRTDYGRSILVHELVHYTQDKCPRATQRILAKREGIAYEAQNRYLESIHSPLRIINPFVVELYGNNPPADEVLQGWSRANRKRVDQLDRAE